MKKAIVPVILFLLQIYLVYKGATHFGKLGNPFVLLAVSGAIPVYCLWHLLRSSKEPALATLSAKPVLIGGILGAVSIAAFYKPLQSVLNEFKDYGSMSDVIPQLETLYNRFANGIFPYAPLEQYPWHPYPVYMPLNWFPVGLASPLHCDVRWVGILFLGICFVLWGIYIWRAKVPALTKLLIIALPAYLLWATIHWNKVDIGVTLETMIMAYYFVLAFGLLSRNLPLTIAGVILCVLSRYTMVFWLPLFLIILWHNAPRSKNYISWLAIIASVLLLYILPFYAKDPSILTSGLAYHNHCYVDAWNGLGNPEQAWVFDEGLNFSWFIREATSGTMEQRVFVGRSIQAAFMLLLFIAAWFGYRKWKEKIHFYDYSLLMLYCFLLLFFMTSPLTYRYYYMPLFMVSLLLAGRMLFLNKRGT